MKTDEQLSCNLQFCHHSRSHKTIPHEDLFDYQILHGVTTQCRCSREKRWKTKFLTAAGLWLIIIVITITVIQQHIASLVCMCSPHCQRALLFCILFCWVHFLALIWWVILLLFVTPEKNWSGKKNECFMDGWMDIFIFVGFKAQIFLLSHLSFFLNFCLSVSFSF